MTPSLKNSLIGYSLGALAALGGALFTIFFREAGRELSPESSTFLIFITSLLCSFLLSIQRKEKFSPLIGWSPKIAILVLLIIFSTIAGNMVYNISIETLSPSIAQVSQRTEIIFIVIMGVFFLKEKGSLMLFIGLLVVISGFLILRYESFNSDNIDILPIILAVLSGFSFALFQILSKIIVQYWKPTKLNMIRLFAQTSIMIFIPGLLTELFSAPWEPIFFGILAGFFGPFMGRMAIMYSIYYIPVSRSILMSALSPIFTGIIQVIFFSEYLTFLEMSGGMIILFGIVLTILPEYFKAKFSKKREALQ